MFTDTVKVTVGGRYMKFVPLGGALDKGCSCMTLGFGGGFH